MDSTCRLSLVYLCTEPVSVCLLILLVERSVGTWKEVRKMLEAVSYFESLVLCYIGRPSKVT